MSSRLIDRECEAGEGEGKRGLTEDNFAHAVGFSRLGVRSIGCDRDRWTRDTASPPCAAASFFLRPAGTDSESLFQDLA